MRAEIDPATGHVKASLDAIGGDDRFQNGLEAKLEVTGPSPSTDKRRVAMRQTAPGRYESDFPLDRYGAFLLHATLEKPEAGDGKKATPVAEGFGHVTNPYPREYLALEPNLAVLAQAAEVTGGATDATPAQVFDPAGESIRFHEDLWPRFVAAAIVVFLLDLFVRRVRLFDRKRTVRPSVARPA
jgi:hypothetical protein